MVQRECVRARRLNEQAWAASTPGRAGDDLSPGLLQVPTGSTTVVRHSCARKPRSQRRRTRIALVAALASGMPVAMAQNCISLADSRACSAFNASSISTDSSLVGLFPFLSSVSSVSSFDSGLESYISSGFTQLRYETLIGCQNLQLSNTTDFYARYTTSVLCNAIVQNSITPCGLSGNAARPLCASSCADYAQSEQEVVASNVCGSHDAGALTQIRADFTNCALPANSLTGSCIEAVVNQPDDCGFSSNLGGLCSYCAASSPNATDSCCVFSNTTHRCQGVALPVIASAALSQVTVTATATPSSTAVPGGSGDTSTPGLTHGQIAGIVIGSILGAFFILGVVIAGCLLFKRRRDRSPATSIFNQPASTRMPPMAFSDGARDGERAGLAVMPGGRVARMAALEGSSSSERDRNVPYTLGAYGGRKSPSDDEHHHGGLGAGLAPPPGRSGSLSSASHHGLDTSQEASPNSTSDNQYTSPESQGQSEQLNFFKDYYSQDEIHPSDVVSALWPYDPRAADEFHLERGDMIKILGIWDDGWATGVRVRQRADDWRPEDKVQRDSGLSGPKPPDTAEEGEVKAFPLVCVCLPQHWKKTIEGDPADPGSFPDRS